MGSAHQSCCCESCPPCLSSCDNTIGGPYSAVERFIITLTNIQIPYTKTLCAQPSCNYGPIYSLTSFAVGVPGPGQIWTGNATFMVCNRQVSFNTSCSFTSCPFPNVRAEISWNHNTGIFQPRPMDISVIGLAPQDGAVPQCGQGSAHGVPCGTSNIGLRASLFKAVVQVNNEAICQGTPINNIPNARTSTPCMQLVADLVGNTYSYGYGGTASVVRVM